MGGACSSKKNNETKEHADTDTLPVEPVPPNPEHQRSFGAAPTALPAPATSEPAVSEHSEEAESESEVEPESPSDNPEFVNARSFVPDSPLGSPERSPELSGIIDKEQEQVENTEQPGIPQLFAISTPQAERQAQNHLTEMEEEGPGNEPAPPSIPAPPSHTSPSTIAATEDQAVPDRRDSFEEIDQEEMSSGAAVLENAAKEGGGENEATKEEEHGEATAANTADEADQSGAVTPLVDETDEVLDSARGSEMEDEEDSGITPKANRPGLVMVTPGGGPEDENLQRVLELERSSQTRKRRRRRCKLFFEYGKCVLGELCSNSHKRTKVTQSIPKLPPINFPRCELNVEWNRTKIFIYDSSFNCVGAVSRNFRGRTVWKYLRRTQDEEQLLNGSEWVELMPSGPPGSRAYGYAKGWNLQLDDKAQLFNAKKDCFESFSHRWRRSADCDPIVVPMRFSVQRRVLGAGVWNVADQSVFLEGEWHVVRCFQNEWNGT